MNNNNTLLDPGLPATCPACWGECRMPNGEPCPACQGGLVRLACGGLVGEQDPELLLDPVAEEFLHLMQTRIARFPRPRVVLIATPGRGDGFLERLYSLPAGERWRLVGVDPLPAGAVRATLSHPMGSMGEEVPAPFVQWADEVLRGVADSLERAE